MPRLLVLFFALLLPAQFAWSAAASYCQHETGPVSAQHIGHHEHVHLAKGKAVSDTRLAADADCGDCNAAGPAIVSQHLAYVPHPMPTSQPRMAATGPPASALARAPDRPQWPRLA